jgi:hypothetical protein
VGINLVWIKSGHILIWETTFLQFLEIRLTLRKHLTYRRSEKRCFWIEPSVDGTIEKLDHSPLVTISILIDPPQRCLNPQDKFGNRGSFAIGRKLATFMNKYRNYGFTGHEKIPQKTNVTPHLYQDSQTT